MEYSGDYRALYKNVKSLSLVGQCSPDDQAELLRFSNCSVIRDLAMTDFDENDVTLVHERLGGGRGYLRLTHRPTGLFVDAELKSEPVIQTMNLLMNNLKGKVLALRGTEQGGD
jgi:hypothetical protein